MAVDHIIDPNGDVVLVIANLSAPTADLCDRPCAAATAPTLRREPTDPIAERPKKRARTSGKKPACSTTPFWLLLETCLIVVQGNCASPHSVWYERVSLRVSTALDIVTDAAIIFLSGNSLWRTRISGRKKLTLVGISLLTAFIIIVALIRMLLSYGGAGIQDPAWLNAWNAIEILVAIIVACLASFWTLYTKSNRRKTELTPNSFSYRTDNTSIEAPILLEDRADPEDNARQKGYVFQRRLNTPDS